MVQQDKGAVIKQGQKRKQPPGGQEVKSANKKARFEKTAASRDARAIISQAADKGLKNGELHTESYVEARRFEANALEQALNNSKKALTKRAFQSVPNDLRRRTASHNAKRVPKRLRPRAKREMKDDNTPTVTARRRKLNSRKRLRFETAKKLRAITARRQKHNATTTDKIVSRPAKIKKNVLADVPVPKAKFKKRQQDKTWLPTHIFHAKRARMTPPREPLWKFAIPLTPSAKSYRTTHRIAGERGAMVFDMSYMSTILLEGRHTSLFALLAALDAEGKIGQLRTPHRWKWIRGSCAVDMHLHHRDAPQGFIAPVTIIWRGSAATSAARTLDELGVSEGSLFIRVHPSAFMRVWEELVRMSKTVRPAIKLQDLRYEIGSIELVGPASSEALAAVLRPVKGQQGLQPLAALSSTALLPAGSILDFECDDPRLHLKQQRQRSASRSKWTNSSLTLEQQLAGGAIFDHTKRWTACRRLCSQKAVNRRRTLAVPGRDPAPSDKDPQIPVLLYTLPGESRHHLSKWTVMLPWKCVLAVWYSLMYLPLSTGQQPRLGCMAEMRHIHLEYGLPWFPADYPTTQSGWQWELTERKRLHGDWKRRPKSKRVNFDGLDLGSTKGEVGQGWSCDWTKLLPSELETSETTMPTQLTQANTSLIQVRLEHVSRGVSNQCARIYRLPVSGELRKEWLALHPVHGLPKKKSTALSRPPADAPAHIVQRHLAQSLLEPPQAGDESWPNCPGEDDLIGFVTSGSFDLGAGRGTAIGSVLTAYATQAGPATEARLCVIRNSGHSIGRLATWEVISG